MKKYVVTEIELEARMKLKVLAVLEGKDMRDYLSDLINKENGIRLKNNKR